MNIERMLADLGEIAASVNNPRHQLKMFLRGPRDDQEKLEETLEATGLNSDDPGELFEAHEIAFQARSPEEATRRSWTTAIPPRQTGRCFTGERSLLSEARAVAQNVQRDVSTPKEPQ